MELQCRLCTSTDKWYCEYTYSQNYRHFKISFETREEAYQHMKEKMEVGETVTRLDIDLELNSKIILCDGDKLINVETVVLNFIGGEDDGAKLECYNFIFRQINLFCLKVVIIRMKDFEIHNPEQNDDLFELVKTMNLEAFTFESLMNEEQFWSIRANRVVLDKGGFLTPSGLVRYVQKLLLEPPASLKCEIYKISHELQYYLCGELFEEHDGGDTYLTLNVPGTKRVLVVWLELQEETDDEDPHAIPKYSAFLTIEYWNMVNSYANNIQALEEYPKLENFIAAVSAALPPGFPLISDVENL